MIVLIGVTGSGKTTVGRLLSERYGKPLYEVDAAVEGLRDSDRVAEVVSIQRVEGE